MSKENIELNSEVSIDLNTLVSTRLLVQANSGGGKSWLIRRILEQSHGKIQHIVIDLEGEFSTLREKYDYILASKDGDVPVEPRSAAVLARRLLELNVSTIIDLYELHTYERKAFVKNFLDALINAPKKSWHPVLVVIDEAHVFCPEKGQSEASQSVIDLATMGRKRGFCAILATQRLSKLNKDAAAECNNKLIGRTGLDIDMKRASEELGFRTKEDYLSLRSLESGEFFAFGPAISKEIIKIKVGDVKTTHPSAESGQVLNSQPAPPTSKIKKMLSKLKDLPQAAEKEAKTIAEFKQKIIQLKREIGVLKRQVKTATPSKEQADKLVARAIAIKEKEMFRERTQMQKQIKNFFSIIEQIGKITQKALNQPVTKFTGLDFGYGKSVSKTTHISRQPNNKPIQPIDEKPLTGGALRMIKILVSKHPMTFTKNQLATFARLSPKSGTYGTYLSRIRNQGLIIEENGVLSASDEALSMFDVTPEAPETSDDLIRMWQSKFNGGARRMFDVLVEYYPSSITRTELGDRVGLESSSGTFGTYLSRLKSNGIIEVANGEIKASDNLFVEE